MRCCRIDSVDDKNVVDHTWLGDKNVKNIKNVDDHTWLGRLLDQLAVAAGKIINNDQNNYDYIND